MRENNLVYVTEHSAHIVGVCGGCEMEVAFPRPACFCDDETFGRRVELAYLALTSYYFLEWNFLD